MMLRYQTQTEIIVTRVSLRFSFCQPKLQKNTWLVCLGYYNEDELSKIYGFDGRADDVAARNLLWLDIKITTFWQTHN